MKQAVLTPSYCRPGNTVQFRVVVLSPQMKPSVTGSIDVRMRDGSGNMIHDWSRVFTTRGVWAGSVDLADKPVMGNWNISVDVNGQIFTKSFQVAEYVLPKFQVIVRAIILQKYLQNNSSLQLFTFLVSSNASSTVASPT